MFANNSCRYQILRGGFPDGARILCPSVIYMTFLSLCHTDAINSMTLWTHEHCQPNISPKRWPCSLHLYSYLQKTHRYVGRRVVCKPNHTNIYFTSSHHRFQSKALAVRSALVHCSIELYDKEHLTGALKFPVTFQVERLHQPAILVKPQPSSEGCPTCRETRYSRFNPSSVLSLHTKTAYLHSTTILV